MRIENWAVIVTGGPYKAPEQRTSHLHGNVFGHTRFDDGHFVTTSTIVGKDDEDHIITQSGSSYELGNICLKYGNLFPGARERLLGGLMTVESADTELIVVDTSSKPRFVRCSPVVRKRRYQIHTKDGIVGWIEHVDATGDWALETAVGYMMTAGFIESVWDTKCAI